MANWSLRPSPPSDRSPRIQKRRVPRNSGAVQELSLFPSSFFTRETFEPRIAQSQPIVFAPRKERETSESHAPRHVFRFLRLSSFFSSLSFPSFFHFCSNSVFLQTIRLSRWSSPSFSPLSYYSTLLRFAFQFSSRRIHNAPRVHPAAFKTANPAIPVSAALCRYSPPPTPCPEVSFPTFPGRRETATPRSAPCIRTESTAVPAWFVPAWQKDTWERERTMFLVLRRLSLGRENDKIIHERQRKSKANRNLSVGEKMISCDKTNLKLYIARTLLSPSDGRDLSAKRWLNANINFVVLIYKSTELIFFRSSRCNTPINQNLYPR